jgi:hypothetical protein
MTYPDKSSSRDRVGTDDTEQRMYPGGYLRCHSTLFVRSWLEGDYTVRCELPDGHEGNEHQRAKGGGSNAVFGWSSL